MKQSPQNSESGDEPLYGVVATSLYVPSFDGTELAIDIHRPARNGMPLSRRFPAIVENTRYQRSSSVPSRGATNFVEHGYIFVAIDPRGAGASFGSRSTDFSPEENRDTAWIIEWVASQDWCSGRVAMIGSSYKGITQFLAAAHKPRGLVALAPTVASLDSYNRTYPNGVGIPQDFVAGITRLQDLGLPPYDGPLHVDSDQSGERLRAARREHLQNFYPHDVLVADMFRDTVDQRLGYAPGIELSPVTFRDSLAQQKLPIMQFAGWYDGAVTSQLATFADLGSRIIVGPWNHWNIDGDVSGIEHLRWFDSTLKEIDNGIDLEAPMRYYTINAEPGHEWESSPSWPVPGVQERRMYFSAKKAGSVSSVNDGSLTTETPDEQLNDYTIDRSVSVFDGEYNKINRQWSGDMTTGTDERGLTYTGRPLSADLRITGHPVVSVTLTSSHDDTQIFAFLEDVSPDGSSRYVSDGMLRASHRAQNTDTEPWKSIGIPYHPSLEATKQPLIPREPATLEFELFPTSYIFRSSHRIRVTLVGAVEPFYRSLPDPEDGSSRTIAVLCGGTNPSSISLPVVEHTQQVTVPTHEKRT